MAGSAAASSSSSSAALTLKEYDVFISFRGEDTRHTFTCHLHRALTDKLITTFIDYDLHKGDEISLSLLQTIERSHISVVVLSENYATSKWCLDELTKMLKCRKDHGHVVIPVFYHIHPSHVRKQLGSYGEAFKKHEKDFWYDMARVQRWKDALTEVASLAGWVSNSRSHRDDSELIQDIVKHILQKLRPLYAIHHTHRVLLSNSKHLVGFDRDYEAVESLLREARVVGIWGIGGIGKTTLAKAIFANWSPRYDAHCFLEYVRERSGKYGQWLPDLRDRLYSSLLGEEVRLNAMLKSPFVETRLSRQTNLIVLDDVSSAQQLDDLLGDFHYAESCTIIITTRDKNVLESRGVEKIHKLEGYFPYLILAKRASCLIVATALCAEYLLFYLHSTTYKGLEGYYHVLFNLRLGFSILSSFDEALFPTSFPVELCSSIALTLHGIWFYQTTFLNGLMLPHGCCLRDSNATCHSKESEVRGELLANVQLFIAVLTVLVGTIASSGFAVIKMWEF